MDSPARRTLFILSISELLAMSLWFAGTAVLPQLTAIWKTSLAFSSWLTLSVQLGFVAGAMLLAIFNVADVFSAPRLIAISAAVAAVLNFLFGLVAHEHMYTAISLRFLTGAALAGVYPPGMKVLAGWFKSGRGEALGLLVGALSIGSATPHGINAFGGVNADSWQTVIFASSALAMIGAALIALFVKDGPYAAPSAPFDIHQVAEVLSFRNQRLGLANLGYLGHMWELYSLWAWIALMLRESATFIGDVTWNVKLLAFIVIGIGSFGCWWAGRIADRAPAGSDTEPTRIRQRSMVTIVAMAVSGSCCLLAAFLFRNFYAMAGICLIWGISVIADSAQFSAIISEVSDQRYVGTALTLQTAMGFLLTAISIRVTAAIGQNCGWQWAAASLAIGPVLGIVAMQRLRSIAVQEK
jgi:MFS family permease